ncbi:MAG: sugar phosphate isomerase/epimerase family protein [Terracidiphilus sp.]
MISPCTDPVGAEIVETLAELQYDYIELSLSHLTALREPVFSNLVRRIERSGIGCEACNNSFPSHIRLTGPDAHLKAALQYAEEALARAAQLGVKTVVFGSAGAKNVPAGFSYKTAWQQIVDLLRSLGERAQKYGITIAVEHLNRQESNIVTLASEAMQLAREVGHPNVQLLIDYYHLRRENEDFGILLEAGSMIRHVHFAEVQSRSFPVEDNEHYGKFFDRLRSLRYDGRCSIEAYTQNLASDGKRALEKLKEIVKSAEM